MRTALLTGAAAAALALAATAAARAETLYVADMDTVVAPSAGYVYADDPDYVVQERTYVQERPYVVVAPPRERVVVVPRREVVAPPREVVIDRPAYAAPRPGYRTVRTNDYSTTTGYGGSCMIDSRGFERCY